MKVVILLGPVGVGKGTIGTRLSEKTGLTFISSGDLLREAVKDKTEIGLQAESFMKTGALVPDNILSKIIEDRGA